MLQTITVYHGCEYGIHVNLHEVITAPDSWAEYTACVVGLICAAVADLNGVSPKQVAQEFIPAIVNALHQQRD